MKPTGKTATLGSVATFSDEAGQTEIRRENLLRFVAVTGRFDGTSLGQGIRLVQKAVSELGLPARGQCNYGGTHAEQPEIVPRSGSGSCLVAIVLVFTVLLFEFRAFAARLRSWLRPCSQHQEFSWR